jgi:hypothetical protein
MVRFTNRSSEVFKLTAHRRSPLYFSSELWWATFV